MTKYKSWSGLKKTLKSRLCEVLKERVDFNLTRYHKVHDAYGRATILVDKKEVVSFSWIEQYKQEEAEAKEFKKDKTKSFEEITALCKAKWDENCTYCDLDFLDAVTQFLNLSIKEALESDNYIIVLLAILDSRTGTRTINYIASQMENYPDWVKQFILLRKE